MNFKALKRSVVLMALTVAFLVGAGMATSSEANAQGWRRHDNRREWRDRHYRDSYRRDWNRRHYDRRHWNRGYYRNNYYGRSYRPYRYGYYDRWGRFHRY